MSVALAFAISGALAYFRSLKMANDPKQILQKRLAELILEVEVLARQARASAAESRRIEATTKRLVAESQRVVATIEGRSKRR